MAKNPVFNSKYMNGKYPITFSPHFRPVWNTPEPKEEIVDISKLISSVAAQDGDIIDENEDTVTKVGIENGYDGDSDTVYINKYHKVVKPNPLYESQLARYNKAKEAHEKAVKNWDKLKKQWDEEQKVQQEKREVSMLKTLLEKHKDKIKDL